MPGTVRLVAICLVAFACACADPTASDVAPLQPPPTDLALVEPATPPPASTTSAGSRAEVRQLLVASARRHGVNPYLVMAVAWWESGWDQTRVSVTGAVGIMQVEPDTAAAAGPRLLQRSANVHDPADNVELGVAVLKEDLDNFHSDLEKALIAYYEGPASVTDWNDQDAGGRRYVMGVYRLAVAFSDGIGPA